MIAMPETLQHEHTPFAAVALLEAKVRLLYRIHMHSNW